MTLTTVERFPKRFAVTYNDGINSQSRTYSHLWQTVQEISSSLSSLQLAGSTVAVILRQNIDLPAILLGLLVNDCCYFPLSIGHGQKYIASSIKRAGATWIIHYSNVTEELSSTVEHLQGTYIDSNTLDKFHVSIVRLGLIGDVCRQAQSPNVAADCQNFAYCITTSGTTSQPKVIKVPHSCIIPNIIDLSKIFQISETDTVLLTAPLTFDPSIIDIFLALSNGARLLVIPDAVKQSPIQFVNMLYSGENVTVLQATPSLIRSCSSQLLQETILGAYSSLRVLALGGEAFPSQSELKKWLHPLNKTCFFNLYGITEVSCWASCELVDAHRHIETNSAVSTGNPLSETLLYVDTDRKEKADKQHERRGFIHIGSSTRVCIVDDSDLPQPFDASDRTIVDRGHSKKIVWRNTGDIGEVLADGKIVFVGREDDQIKRHGKRMTLSALETVCCNVPWVSNCCSLTDQQNQLILFYTVQNPEPKSIPSNSKNDDACHGAAKNIHVALTNVSQGNQSDNCQLKGSRFIKRKENERLNLNDSRNLIDDNTVPILLHDFNGENPNLNDVHQMNTDLKQKKSDGDIIETGAGEEYSLRMFIADSLPSHYIPDRLAKMESFPLTTHGKLDKKRLLQMDWDTVTSIELVRESPVDWLRQLWVTHLPKVKSYINMTDNFLSLGGDSLAAVNLSNKVEKAFGEEALSFLDTLLNRSFGACVELILDYLKRDVNNKECSTFPREMNDRCGDKIKHSGVGYCGEVHNDRLEFCGGKLCKNDGCNNIGLPSPGKTCTCETDFSRNVYETYRHSPYSSHQTCEGGLGHSSCVIGRGNRKMMGGRVRESLQDQNKDDYQKQQCLQGHKLPADLLDNNRKSQKIKHNYADRQRRSESQLPLLAKLEKSPGEAYRLCLKWTIDNQKCVDASPVIAVFSRRESLVIIGSHSGRLSSVDLDTGYYRWTTELPDRIESSACVTYSTAHVVVGCYDGVVYVLDVNTGEVEWEFATGACVKCSPFCDDVTGHVICGSHDGWLYSLDVEKKQCVWKHFLGGGSVYSSPLSDPLSHLVLAASLRGNLVALNCTNGSPVWCVDLKKPLFSSPCLHGSSILIGCVDCCLYCIDVQGQKEWFFKTEGPIFSSPVSYKGHVFFGCHDCHFYCLASNGQLIWKIQTPSQIFSTPFVFEFQCRASVLISHNDENQSGASFYSETAAEPKIKIPKISKNEENSSPNEHYDQSFSGTKLFDNINSPEQIINNDLIVNKRLATHKEDIVENNEFDYEQTSSMRNDTNFYCDKDGGSEIIYKEKTLIIFASTEGTLQIVEGENGKTLTGTHLNGEVFSSPVFHDGKIVVGCRDNLLYCFDFYS